MDTALLDLPDSADATLYETVACRRSADAAETRIVQLAVVGRPAPGRGSPGRRLGAHRRARPGSAADGGRVRDPRARRGPGLSTPAATRQVHESLELRHRLPRHSAALATVEIQAWRALRIARHTLSQPDDVTEYVDEVLATRANRVGVIAIENTITAAMILFHPEELEMQRLEELSKRSPAPTTPPPGTTEARSRPSSTWSASGPAAPT